MRQRWAECTGGEFLDEALFHVFEGRSQGGALG